VSTSNRPSLYAFTAQASVSGPGVGADVGGVVVEPSGYAAQLPGSEADVGGAVEKPEVLDSSPSSPPHPVDAATNASVIRQTPCFRTFCIESPRSLDATLAGSCVDEHFKATSTDAITAAILFCNWSPELMSPVSVAQQRSALRQIADRSRHRAGAVWRSWNTCS
jgi:hypothetical protein